jgi:TPP-dependent pyruvate/acetoin dehydrogenase alpha subunit
MERASKRELANADELQQYDRALLVEMLYRMVLIRSFDSQLPNLTTQGHIRGSSHSCIGQEATAVGACAALRKTDYVTSTHRGHGHTIAKGGDVKRMMAELLGKANGYCRGKGGSMHIADFSIGMLGANGIVGGGIGLATGAALSASIRGTDQVTLCFFGDGAINQGILLECGNMAALWKLPLVLFCENNQFSMSTRPHQVTSTKELAPRLEGLGIPGTAVDGMNVLKVHETVCESVDRARKGGGPSFVEALCYRFDGHFLGDGLKYRSQQELLTWRERDPVSYWRQRLIQSGIISEAEARDIDEKSKAEVEEAVKCAIDSPFPDSVEVWEDLYA